MARKHLERSRRSGVPSHGWEHPHPDDPMSGPGSRHGGPGARDRLEHGAGAGPLMETASEGRAVQSGEESAGELAGSKPVQCLVWLPLSYTGRGPPESCARIIASFPAAGLHTTVFTLRQRKAMPAGIESVEALPAPLRHVPLALFATLGRARLKQMFAEAIRRAPPGSIAYFWPDEDLDLIRLAGEHGLLTVREMINSPRAMAKSILDAAYRSAGLEPSHGISAGLVAEELAGLPLYDRFFSSNPEVDRSLLALGIDEAQILQSSFGWTDGRFFEGHPEPDASRPFRAVFVGLTNVRKGLPTLLAAWEEAAIEGELVIAGVIEPCLRDLIAQHVARGKVRHLGHVKDVAALYRSSDVFVFPTHEEGGPQVTYEAAACEVPIITTPMGAARLVRDGETGLVVEAGHTQGLANAIRTIAADQEFARRLAAAAKAEVDRFEYAVVGRQRAQLLLREQAVHTFERVAV